MKSELRMSTLISVAMFKLNSIGASFPWTTRLDTCWQEQKGCRYDERWILRKDHHRVCRFETETIFFKVDEDAEPTEVKKCSGTKKDVIKNRIEHKDLKKRPDYWGARDATHEHSRRLPLFTEEVNKVALSAEDDKRVIRRMAYIPWQSDIIGTNDYYTSNSNITCDPETVVKVQTCYSPVSRRK